MAGYVNPEIYIYDIETLELVKTLTNLSVHTGDIFSVNYSKDGSQLASCGEEGNIVKK